MRNSRCFRASVIKLALKILYVNIKELLQAYLINPGIKKAKAMDEVAIVSNAWLLTEKEGILGFGVMTSNVPPADRVIDCSGRCVFPSFVDSHTHLVFAQSREEEFLYKIQGISYEEIAARGGGILNSAEKLQQLDEDVLFARSLERLQSAIRNGTGCIEIKSGYGLSYEAELKMLRVIQRLKHNVDIPIKASLLAAHAIPKAYQQNPDAYINMIVDKLIPQVAQEGLADYIDVFCEKGYFSVAQMEHILSAAAHFGLRPKVHVNQFNALGGIAAAVKHHAVSVDHLEQLADDDIAALQHSDTIPVALPGCSFYLGIPFTPAKTLIEAGLPVVLASDFNPGSSPSFNMQFVWSLACIKMKLTPLQALNALTLNAAYALNLSEEVGSITPGKRANFIITKPLSSHTYIPYSFGENCIEQVIVNGKAVNS